MKETQNTLCYFLKHFTVIDFLGYMIPGAIMVLFAGKYFGGIKDLWTDFFGDQVFLLLIYFITLSYVVGTVLHEISQPFNLIIHNIFLNDYYKNKNVQIKKEFPDFFKSRPDHNDKKDKNDKHENTEIKGEDSDCSKGQPKLGETSQNSDDAEYTYYRQVYHYVQEELEKTKVPLFHAFATFSRLCATVALIVAGTVLWEKWNNGGSSASVWLPFLASLAISFVFLERCHRFYKIIAEYVYDLFFVKKKNQKVAKKAEAVTR